MAKHFSEIFFSDSQKMEDIRELISDVAKSDVPVLIRGESGTGKDLVAQTLHLNSLRSKKPFIKVNCATIPKGLIESELFGFERGAFTGANRRKPGKFELANDGTILLNDIEEFNNSTQAKLLQVLQDGEFSHLGSEESISVNVRLVTAAKGQLDQLVADGRFREDLFHRINVISVHLPPLRDRTEQIPALAEYFVTLYAGKYLKGTPTLSSKAMKAFLRYPWPGNIRELENVVKRIVLLGEEDRVISDLACNPACHGRGAELGKKGPSEPFLRDAGGVKLREIGKAAGEIAEKELIQRMLQETRWNRKAAATLLRVSYRALLYKIYKYRLDL